MKRLHLLVTTALLMSCSRTDSAPTPSPSPAPAPDSAPTPAPDSAPAPTPDSAPAPTPYRSSPPPSADPSGPSSGGPAGPAPALRDRPAVGEPAPDSAPAPTASYLHGTITLPGDMKLRFVVARTPGRVTLDIPDQRLVGAPITDFVEDGDTLTFSFAPPGAPASALARFSAKREADASYRGTLDQGGMKLPITLSPSSEEELAKKNRPQTPTPPFPYPTHELTIAVDGGLLACTLALPAGPGPHPAIAMRTGSGAQDRDETLFEHRPFLVLADAFAKGGIATLRCDDRGAGASAQARQEDDLAVFADDARRMLVTLAERPEIDRTKLGVLGHSEGGITVATLVAEDAPPIVTSQGPIRPAFGVTLSGPVLSGREVLVQQNKDLVRDQGGSAEHIEAIGRTVDALFAAIAEGADEATLDQRAADLADAAIAAAGPNAGQTREQLIAQHKSLAQNPWMRSFVRSHPLHDLVKSRVPVLALFGANDWQVKADAHATALSKALKAEQRVAVEIVPRTNHLLQTTDTGALAEYAELEETMSPTVLARVVTWTRESVGLEKPSELE